MDRLPNFQEEPENTVQYIQAVAPGQNYHRHLQKHNSVIASGCYKPTTSGGLSRTIPLTFDFSLSYLRIESFL